LAEAAEAGWAHVFHGVVFSDVDVEVPRWRIVLVGGFKIEDVGLEVDWEHRFGVEVHNVKLWRLALVCCDGANDEVHADALSGVDIAHDLVELGVDVREDAEADNVLEAVGDGVVSPSILPRALIKIGNVGNDNRVSVLLFELAELSCEPFEHVSRVAECGPAVEIGGVADV